MNAIENEGVTSLAGTDINLPDAETWEEFVRTIILMSMSDGVCTVNDLQIQPFMGANFGFIKRRFKHHVTEGEIRDIIREMHRIGLIEPAQYKCECCKERKDIVDILDHVIAFRITTLGKEQIPQPLFP